MVAACAANLQRALLATTVRLRTGATSGSGTLVTDEAIARVVAAARRFDAAIVVVSGETSAAVVRQLVTATGLPVLVARSREPWRTVLAATDLAASTLPVVALATAVAARVGAAAEVLHNLAPGWTPPSAAPAASDAATRRMTRRLTRLARLAAERAPSTSVQVSSLHLPEHAIVSAAAEHEVDLLVVGMHPPGPAPARRCADGVLEQAIGNVLVVPVARRPRPAPTGLMS